MNSISVNFSEKIKPVKPLHGVTNGPCTSNFWYDATEWFQKAGIPFSRLHDTEYPYGCGEFVDISCIFKDMSADENLEENYNFTQTDDYLASILNAGARIIYRLGYSIEHQPDKLYIYKPEDPEKWARICSHIIRHYNEGWANGFHWDIRYWEIWNEPDLQDGPPRTWIGTDEEFFAFYETVATYLRKEHGDILIGGPTAAFPDGKFLDNFLAFAAEKKLPLDFLSWHSYLKDVEGFVRNADVIDGLLKKYGFTNTESVLDEWNYIPSWEYLDDSCARLATMEGAAFDAAVMCALQDTGVDIATYYDAQLIWGGGFNGLFKAGFTTSHRIGNPVIPLKPYYSLEAFGELYRLGTQVKTEISAPGVYGMAAAGEAGKAAVFSNMNREGSCELTVQFEKDYEAVEIYLLDDRHNLERINVLTGNRIHLSMDPLTVVLIRIAGRND